MRNLLLTLAALVFGIGVVEGVAHWFLPASSFEHDRKLFGDRREIGWGPLQAGQYNARRLEGGKIIYSVLYTIDPDLLRHVDSDAEGPTIAFFGDSFTFGDGVGDDATLPQHFAKLAPGFHVLNLAFSAYSPAQMLRELEIGLFDTELKRSRVFLIETGPFHAERIVCKTDFSLRAPRYSTVDSKLVYRGPCTSGAWRKFREFTAGTALERAILSPVRRKITHEDVVDYINVVRAASALAREKYHVPLVIIYVPALPHMLDGTGFSDEDVRKRMRADDVVLISNEIDETRPVRIPGDGHYTSLGNQLIAQKVFDYLKATLPSVLRVDANKD